MKTGDTLQNQPIVLFDGVCNFCSASVQFVIKRNSRSNIMFCQIQSEPGQRLIAEYGLSGLGLNSMVLIHRGKAYIKSSAALRIAAMMDMPWPLMFVFIVVPPFIRHRVYDWIGQRRYHWYGKRDACWVPDTEIQNRFLS
jgi:predicted DCC family thiol-disulfide oxidoreductase YuxK